jgi:hypothetical protein
MKFEPIGVDWACDCIGYACVEASGKNVANGVTVNMINVTKLGGGLGVTGAHIPNDPDKLQSHEQ